MLLHLSFDQVSHELSKGRLVISFVTIFTQVPSSCNTNVSAVFRNKLILNPGVSLELVPVGGDDPGEGVPGDHKAGGVLELPQVGQSPSSVSEYGTLEIRYQYHNIAIRQPRRQDLVGWKGRIFYEVDHDICTDIFTDIQCVFSDIWRGQDSRSMRVQISAWTRGQNGA